MKSNKLILIPLLYLGINVAKAQQAVDAAGGNDLIGLFVSVK